MRVAAIGIGSNSLRMLVADVNNNELIRVRRFREGLRVFAALDSQKNIRPEMLVQAGRSVKAFCEEALSMGATAMHLFATSAVRDAANQTIFAQMMKEACGLDLEICSGEEEARLSYLGATEGEACGLIDIGGGSTEIAIGSNAQIHQACSLQMGAVRLSRIIPINQPADAWRVVDVAAETIERVCDTYMHRSGRTWTGVGGTFTSCAAVAQHIPWQYREQIHGYELKTDMVRNVINELASMTLEERTKLSCLQPQRADIVIHGLAVLVACMQSLSIPVIKVSEYGNLEGYLKTKYLI